MYSIDLSKQSMYFCCKQRFGRKIEHSSSVIVFFAYSFTISSALDLKDQSMKKNTTYLQQQPFTTMCSRGCGATKCFRAE